MNGTIIVEHLEGPLSGTRTELSADTPEITIGRDADSQIRFPNEERIVGRRHLRLVRQPSGHYVAELFGDRYLTIDGQPAEKFQHVPDGAKLRLGGKDGPLLSIRYEKGAADDPWKTIVNDTMPNVWRTIQKSRLHQGIALAGVLALVLGLGGWVYVDRTSLKAEIARLRDAIADEIPPDKRGDVLNAAYAVVLRSSSGDRILGTAWPVTPTTAVTNAHVVGGQNKQRLRLTSPSGRSFDVVEIEAHHGYNELRRFIETEARESGPVRAAGLVDGLPRAYDLAVITVDGPFDDPPLAVATSEDLAELEPGDALAFAGYPIEGVAGETHAVEAINPQLQFGRVTSLTDAFLFRTTGDESIVVHHSIPATGGASGAPIINAKGKVVAVLSGGNLFRTASGARSPSAVQINYAQRADVLFPLIGGTKPFDVDLEKTKWARQIGRFNRHRDQLLQEILDELQAGSLVSSQLESAQETVGAGSRKAGPVRYNAHDLSVQAGKSYAFLAYGAPGDSLALALRHANGKEPEFSETTSWFPKIMFQAEADETIEVRIIGRADKESAYSWYVFATGGEQTARGP